MSDAGNYRSIGTVIVDLPEFQALSPGAKLVWYTLKMTLGPSGISNVPSLVSTLAERTGLESAQIEKGLAQLEAAGWFRRERSIAWLVDGLQDDPHMSLDNQNHRTKIARYLNALPQFPIVDAFRAHYGFAPKPAERPTKMALHAPHSDESDASAPSKMGSKMPSKEASNIPSSISKNEEGKTEKGEGKTSAAKGAAVKKTRAGHPTWLSPFAQAWRAKYGGEMSAGVAVKALHKLVEEHDADEVLRRWVIYLEATAAEYANAPKFASTWGRWAAAVVRSPVTATAGVPSGGDQARAEAGQIVARIRAKVFTQAIPGQGSKPLLRIADVEAMGEDIAAALRTCGGVARLVKLEQEASDIPFYIRDFAAALYAARTAPAEPVHPEAQSA